LIKGVLYKQRGICFSPSNYFENGLFHLVSNRDLQITLA